ncbi:MAG: hypothetical protein SOU32_10450, partial [Lachnospiraceae bacterium]|nr:hypothetical protein [Lachnospiraceae bacterium]
EMARKRDQPWLISLQAGMQPPGRYSLNHYYGLWPEREGLHLVLQLRTAIHPTAQGHVGFLAETL